MMDLTFPGWWHEGEKADAVEPWEVFHVTLYGEEAGDIADTPELIADVLRASGYRLKLEKIEEEAA